MSTSSLSSKKVRKVGKKIVKEIRAAKLHFKSYCKHINREVAFQCISETLMNNIISSVVQHQLTPLQITFGVHLGDHNMLLTEMYKYNVCCSLDELRRFRRSVAVQSSKEKLLAGLRYATLGGLVQIIIDKFDGVISSQNGQLECHYMAMQPTQSKGYLNCQDGMNMTIPRISKEEMKRLSQWRHQL